MQQNCLYKYWGTIFSNPFHGISKMRSVSKCHLNVLGYTPRCHAWDLMIHINIFLTGKNVNNSFKSLFTETEYLSPCNSFVSFLFLTNGITRCWVSWFFCLFVFLWSFFFLPFLVNMFTYFSWVVWIKNHHLSQRKNDYILHWLGQSQKRPVLHEAIIQCRAFIWKMGSQLQSPFSELSRVEPAGSFTSESKFVSQLLRILISPNISKHAVTYILIFPWKVFPQGWPSFSKWSST